MNIQNTLNQLEKALPGRVKTSNTVRQAHAQSETHFPQYLPDGVVFVKNTAEISTVMQICYRESCPVVAWGCGTSLEGHALAVQGGISLNMMGMNQVLNVHQADMDVVVQPGVTRKQLNEELRATGLFFSVDPGADASLGGMAATCASGTTALRYGTMRENVRALEVVMADGRIIRTGSRARKSSAGYDLTGMFVGSEGTLGIITELTVRLHAIPEAISAATCTFANIVDAVEAVVSIMQFAVPAARMELVDDTYIAAINSYSALDLPCRPHVFFEFHGSKNAVCEHAELVGEIVKGHGGGAFDWHDTTEAREKLWQARHQAYPSMMARYPNHSAMVTDICVPITHLAAMIDSAHKDIAQSPIKGAVIGHVGDGNFHTQLMMRDGYPEDVEHAKELANRMACRAIEVGGTISGEHGIGLGKACLMDTQHGEALSVMEELKRALDQRGVLNPGKIFPN